MYQYQDILERGIEISPINLEEDCGVWCSSEFEGEISSLFLVINNPDIFINYK